MPFIVRPSDCRHHVRGVQLIALLGAIAIVACTRGAADVAPPRVDDSARFSDLTSITRENVASLEPAWTYHSGDVSGGRGPEPAGAVESVQVRPVFADGVLYVTPPSSIVIALDGDTGAEVWRHDPQAGPPTRCYAPHRRPRARCTHRT